jgi:hypothetical protein
LVTRPVTEMPTTLFGSPSISSIIGRASVPRA